MLEEHLVFVSSPAEDKHSSIENKELLDKRIPENRENLVEVDDILSIFMINEVKKQ